MGLGFWGQRWVESELSLKNLDPSLLMWDMRRNLNPRAAAAATLHDTVSIPRAAEVPEELVAGRRRAARSTCCGFDPGYEIDLLVQEPAAGP